MLNLVASNPKSIAYRATRPVQVMRGGKVTQNLSRMYMYRDALAEALAISCVCNNKSYEVVTVDEAIRIYESDKTRFTSFKFIKVSDLTERTISTKKWSGYTHKSDRVRTENPDQYSIFDTNAARGMSKQDIEAGRAMRSFNKNTLVSMQHNGKLYIIA